MNDKEIKTAKYYGKKTYRLNALIVRKKSVDEKNPDYRDHEAKSPKSPLIRIKN